jgi:predicted membrane-bound spermidine synthase
VANELTAETLGAFAGVDEGYALVWLGTLHQAGFMTTEYHWYCPTTGELLLTTETVDEAPDDVKCHRCSTTHRAATECHVSLIFHPKTSTASAVAGGAKGEGDATD